MSCSRILRNFTLSALEHSSRLSYSASNLLLSKLINCNDLIGFCTTSATTSSFSFRKVTFSNFSDFLCYFTELLLGGAVIFELAFVLVQLIHLQNTVVVVSQDLPIVIHAEVELLEVFVQLLELHRVGQCLLFLRFIAARIREALRSFNIQRTKGLHLCGVSLSQSEVFLVIFIQLSKDSLQLLQRIGIRGDYHFVVIVVVNLGEPKVELLAVGVFRISFRLVRLVAAFDEYRIRYFPFGCSIVTNLVDDVKGRYHHWNLRGLR